MAFILIKSVIAVTLLAGLTLVLGKKFTKLVGSPHKSRDEPQLRIDENTINQIEDKVIFAVNQVNNFTILQFYNFTNKQTKKNRIFVLSKHARF